VLLRSSLTCRALKAQVVVCAAVNRALVALPLASGVGGELAH
jgi:hypothetical protein